MATKQKTNEEKRADAESKAHADAIEAERLSREALSEKRAAYDQLKPADPQWIPQGRTVLSQTVKGQDDKVIELVPDGAATTVRLGKEEIVLDAEGARALSRIAQHRANEL